MVVKLLKVIGRHQILMLAVHKQISLREAARWVGLSLRHTKRLVKKIKRSWRRYPLPFISALAPSMEQVFPTGQECRSSFKGGKTPEL